MDFPRRGGGHAAVEQAVLLQYKEPRMTGEMEGAPRRPGSRHSAFTALRWVKFAHLFSGTRGLRTSWRYKGGASPALGRWRSSTSVPSSTARRNRCGAALAPDYQEIK